MTGYTGKGQAKMTVASEEKLYELTDVGNAERLVDKFGSVIRYVPELHTWMHYDGTQWKRVDTVFMNGLAKQVVRDMQMEANIKDGDSDQERDRKLRLLNWAKRTSMQRYTSLMVEQARDAVLAHPNDFDIDPWLVNAQDVTIDLRTGTTHEHNPDDMTAKVAGTSYYGESNGQRFMQFIDDVTGGDKELARYIQKILGYGLSGVIREQHLFMPYGSGRNGKTVLYEIVAEVMGEYAAVGDPSLLVDKGYLKTKNFSLATLVGVRTVVFAESNDGNKLNADAVKSLSGGDSVPAEAKYQMPFSFKPQFKMHLYTNNLPVAEEVGDALWERLRVIPFNQCFIKGRSDCHEPDTELTEKLRAEKPFILRWLVEGNKMWQEEGLEEPESVKEATKVYRADSDVLAEFIEACIAREPGSKVTSKELYSAYIAWYDGELVDQLDRKVFGKKFSEHNFKSRRSNGQTVYQDVTIKDFQRPEREGRRLYGEAAYYASRHINDTEREEDV